jgi:hypothetical protein
VIESAANYNHDGCVVLLEYFCLLLNPDEDTVSTAPKYTYQFSKYFNPDEDTVSTAPKYIYQFSKYFT